MFEKDPFKDLCDRRTSFFLAFVLCQFLASFCGVDVCLYHPHRGLLLGAESHIPRH